LGLNRSQLDRKVWLLCENLKSLEQEELYWFERSHETWLLQGDNNTVYFHKCNNGRRRKNQILSLENDGLMIEGDDNLLKHASEYYSDLFGSPIEYEVQIDPSLWDGIPKVLEEENDVLCRPFSETDIKEALYQMEKTKPQGRTKYPLNFTKVVGTSLGLTLYSYLMTFTIRMLTPVE
jgi:hypothetical protein